MDVWWRAQVGTRSWMKTWRSLGTAAAHYRMRHRSAADVAVVGRRDTDHRTVGGRMEKAM